jgi:5-methylcytosine-specific restriction endonuclease McrA
MKSARTKACEIPLSVKIEVLERDQYCILCGRPGNPDAHYRPKSAGGKGIVQNIVTLCPECHKAYDNGSERDRNLREELGAKIRAYLDERYPGYEDRIFHK